MFLTVDQVAKRLSARAKPVRRKQVYQWVNVGVKAPSGERVKLRCNRLPGGMVFLERDVEAFIERLNAAWAQRSTENVESRPSVAPAMAPTPARTRGFARCAPSEIGTYPPATRRGRTTAVAEVSGGGGRHAGRRAAAPVAGSET